MAVAMTIVGTTWGYAEVRVGCDNCDVLKLTKLSITVTPRNVSRLRAARARRVAAVRENALLSSHEGQRDRGADLIASDDAALRST